MEFYRVYQMDRIRREPDVWRFNVSIRTALGQVFLKGFRVDDNDTLLMPAYKAGVHFAPIVKLPRLLRTAVLNKALKERRRLQLQPQEVE